MGVKEINHRLASLFNNLGNGVRIEVLEYLQGEVDEAYVGEIAEHLGRPNNTISGHLKVLKDYDLLRSETRGRHKFYWIKRPELAKACLSIRDHLMRGEDQAE